MKLNQEEIKQQLVNWMVNFVEQPNTELGDWAPCPYARQARINNQIEIKFCEVAEFNAVVEQSVKDLETKDAVVVCFNHNDISPETLQEWVTEINKSLMLKNYVILEDHPNAVEYVNGVCMNFGFCGLLVIQSLSKLNTASDQLKSKGYYNHWDQSALDAVVTWRHK
jgi:hypothetical protein